MTVAAKPKSGGFRGLPVFALLTSAYVCMFGLYLGILGYALNAILYTNESLAENQADMYSVGVEQLSATARTLLIQEHWDPTKWPILNLQWTMEAFLPTLEFEEGVQMLTFLDDRYKNPFIYGADALNEAQENEIWKIWPLMNQPTNFFDDRVNNKFNLESLKQWKVDRAADATQVAQIDLWIRVYERLTQGDAFGPELDFSNATGQTSLGGIDSFLLEDTESWFFKRDAYMVKVSMIESHLFSPPDYLYPTQPAYHFYPEVQVILYPTELYYTRQWNYMTNIIIVVTIAVAIALCGVALVAFRVAASSRELVAALKLIKDLSLTEDPINDVKSMREISSIQSSMRSMKEALKSFRKFIPQQIVDDMVREQKAAEMNVQFRDVAIFFSDIQGFTTMVEKLNSDDLMVFLHDYLSVMSTIITDNEGTVVEYVGDAIMGAFNAPDDVADFATKGINSMIAQQDISASFSAKWMKKGVISEPIHIRMGMHHDKCLAGVFGSEARLKYGMTGDAVNLSARLEEVCKQYGVYTCISDAMVDVCDSSKFCFRVLDKVTVLGRTQATTLYEVVGRAHEVSNAQKQKSALAMSAHTKYVAGDFEGCKAELSGWLANNGADFAFSKTVASCERFIASPPADWDGITHLDTK